MLKQEPPHDQAHSVQHRNDTANVACAYMEEERDTKYIKRVRVETHILMGDKGSATGAFWD